MQFILLRKHAIKKTLCANKLHVFKLTSMPINKQKTICYLIYNLSCAQVRCTHSRIFGGIKLMDQMGLNLMPYWSLADIEVPQSASLRIQIFFLVFTCIWTNTIPESSAK